MENNWKFYHIGLVVQDMDEAVAYYRSLGATIGIPRLPSEFYLDSSKCLHYELHGKAPASLHKVKALLVNIDGLLIELLQPLEGETLYKEFLERQGEGTHHMAFYVDDLEEESAKLVQKGFPVITKGTFQSGVSFAYFDTTKFGNLVTELVQLPK